VYSRWAPGPTIAVAVLVALLAGVVSALHAQPVSKPPGTIVALYGYGPDSIANLSFSDGLRNALRGAGAPAPAYFSEYLDATRLSSADYASAAREYLEQKYAGRRVDAVIVEGESTFSFLLQHRDTLFAGVPIVHAAVIPALLDAEHAGTTVTGVVARGACRQTIELARTLQPGIDQVYVVLSMPQRHGPWIEAAIREELQALNPPMTVTYLIDLPTADVVRAIEKAPARSIVLYLRHSDDAPGGALQPTDALTLIAGVSPVPVYGVSAWYVGEGIVGGYVTDQRMMGAQVGEMALRVVNGASLRDVPVAAAALTPMFDARALRRWKISESRLPADAVVRFEDSSSWWTGHGISAATGLLMGLAVSGLAGTLWLEHRRRQLAEVEARRHLATMADLDRRAAMGHLTASLAHELRQPLGAILRNSEAATALLATDTPNVVELQEIVEDIRKDDKRAAEIIRRVKGLLEKHEAKEEAVNVNDVARETVEFLAPDAAARGATLQTSLQNPAIVRGDRVHLQQVLVNLILNGLDAMTATPPDRRTVLVATSPRNGQLELTVTDRGAGIPTASLLRVFDPFFSTKSDGMGMGLSVARGIVEAHGGRIVAQNNVDRGATMRVLLPLRSRGTQRHDEHDTPYRI
jgi:signal transduction histidine kinase